MERGRTPQETARFGPLCLSCGAGPHTGKSCADAYAEGLERIATAREQRWPISVWLSVLALALPAFALVCWISFEAWALPEARRDMLMLLGALAVFVAVFRLSSYFEPPQGNVTMFGTGHQGDPFRPAARPLLPDWPDAPEATVTVPYKPPTGGMGARTRRRLKRAQGAL